MSRDLRYDGGSLQRPDSGALCTPEGEEVVTFHPSCFHPDGTWRTDVVVALIGLMVVPWRDACLAAKPVAPLPPGIEDLEARRQANRFLEALARFGVVPTTLIYREIVAAFHAMRLPQDQQAATL